MKKKTRYCIRYAVFCNLSILALFFVGMYCICISISICICIVSGGQSCVSFPWCIIRLHLCSYWWKTSGDQWFSCNKDKIKIFLLSPQNSWYYYDIKANNFSGWLLFAKVLMPHVNIPCQILPQLLAFYRFTSCSICNISYTVMCRCRFKWEILVVLFSANYNCSF